MKLSFGSNISSLMAQRRGAAAGDARIAAMERLASGMRINRASDDPAGLAVAMSLHQRMNTYARAVMNANDGLSMLSVKQGALQAVSDVVQRITELAEQAANGPYSTTQRNALDREAQALWREVDRIRQSTTFNGLSLLSEQASVSLQVGIDGAASSRLAVTLGSELFSAGTFDGTLSGSGEYSGIGRVQHLLFADMNGDGNQDAITLGFNSSSVFVNLGNGDGTFRAGFSSAGNAAGMTAGDIDGDGDIDLVGTRNNLFAVYINQGGSSFSQSTFSLLGSDAAMDSSLLTDINNDGVSDYILVSDSTESVMVLTGNANGSFNAMANYAAGFDVSSATMADYNNDGRLDIIASGSTAHAIFFGQAGGSFSAPQVIADVPQYATSGDLNEDGYIDLIGTDAPGGTTVYVSYGDGTGNFTAKAVVGTEAVDGEVTVGDINEDGFLDMFRIVRNTGETYVNLGNGDGSFRAAITGLSPSGNGLRPTLADVDNDGVIDIGTPTYDRNGFAMVLAGSVAGGVDSFSLSTRQDALSTLDLMRSALTTLAEDLSQIGVEQSRIAAAISNLESQRTITAEAHDRISSADIASETATMVRMTIIERSALMVQAQANQLPALALALLKD